MISAIRRLSSIRLWFAVAAALAVLVALALQAPDRAGATPLAGSHVVVTLLDSHGVGIAGGTILYGSPNGGWYTLGITGNDGTASGTAPAGSWLGVNYHQGGLDSGGPVVVGDNFAYTFNTVSVTLLNSGPLIYAKNANSGWVTFTNPMELLPGDYLVATSQTQFPLTVGTTNFTGGVVRLVDHNGNGLAGGTVDRYLGSWQSLPGQTDSNGNLVFSLPNDSPYLSMAMYYQGTRNQQSRTELGASNFTFQTTLATVKLKDADGNPLDTGSVMYYAGAWRSFGTGAVGQPGGTTSGGAISQEMLSGAYSFAMVYNHTRQQRDNVAISGATTDVVFQTGRLSLQFSQPVTWYANGYYTLVSPMEFLPGTTTFYLGGSSSNCSVGIAITSGDHLVKSGIVATLKNSAGQPLGGGVATVYAGGWQSVGTTDSQGRTCQVLNGTLGNTSVRMEYNGTSQQITQSQPANSIYAFQTTLVTVELRNSAGALIDTGNASYYAGGWHTIGDTAGGKTTVAMLPGSYSFAMTYNGTRSQQNGVGISGTTDTVTFQTTLVTVELRDHAGALISTPGNASYYAGSWRTIGDTAGGQVTVEMLPGSYSFAMTYLGTRAQQNGVAISGTTDTVTFQTSSVVSGTGTATQYYAGSWRSFTNGMELLPGTYTFHFNDSTPNTAYALTGGAVTTIH